MKKILIYFLLSALFVLLLFVVYFALGILIDLFNIFMVNSIFAPFYKTFGITWVWDIWHYILVFVISLSGTTNIIVNIKNKIKEKGWL